jgi:hypothetical protein
MMRCGGVALTLLGLASLGCGRIAELHATDGGSDSSISPDSVTPDGDASASCDALGEQRSCVFVEPAPGDRFNMPGIESCGPDGQLGPCGPPPYDDSQSTNGRVVEIATDALLYEVLWSAGDLLTHADSASSFTVTNGSITVSGDPGGSAALRLGPYSVNVRAGCVPHGMRLDVISTTSGDSALSMTLLNGGSVVSEHTFLGAAPPNQWRAWDIVPLSQQEFGLTANFVRASDGAWPTVRALRVRWRLDCG